MTTYRSPATRIIPSITVTTPKKSLACGAAADLTLAG